jgi:hypothetical protein
MECDAHPASRPRRRPNSGALSRQTPVTEIALIDYPDQPSYGAGEAACAHVAAALVNAIFDAIRDQAAQWTLHSGSGTRSP